MKFKYF